VHRSAIGYKPGKIFCYKTTCQVKKNYTNNLNGGYIQLVKGSSPLPGTKQQVAVSKWLNRQMHIYFNDQELNFIELKNKPAKKGYKIYKPAKDHLWGKLNQ
jgi:hypothetical protein